MLFGIDGVDAHAEDGWAGRRVAFGDAVVRMHGARRPLRRDDAGSGHGRPGSRYPALSGEYRSEIETDEPLPFGVWGGVEQPGRVRVGDPVEPL